jgi:glutathione peroxidase
MTGFEGLLPRIFSPLHRWIALVALLTISFAMDNAVAKGAGAATASQACPALLDRSFARLQDDSPQRLCQFAGKVSLVVNTASYCGFTRQYEGLEALQRTYRDRGFTVLGFPSNDFGGQEPGSSREIAEFCFNTYGVDFPMFAKTAVKGSGADPFFSALARATGSAPKWNFHKYLIGRDGTVIGHFSSAVEPNDPALRRAIERALGH